jgi:hypothetical protein
MKIESHSCDTGDCLLCRQGVPRVPASVPLRTCADCTSFSHCQWLLQRKGNETECDWSPSRFLRKAAPSS